MYGKKKEKVMKKILLSALLCIVNVTVNAQTIAVGNPRAILMNNGFYNGFNNYSALAQCQQMNEAQINMLSRVNMENQICVYETYAKLAEKYITNPPEQYIPPKSIVITLNKQEYSEQQKKQLQQTSNMCQNLAMQMREKLKLMYSVDNLICK